jgi:hypothetical protein
MNFRFQRVHRKVISEHKDIGGTQHKIYLNEMDFGG